MIYGPNSDGGSRYLPAAFAEACEDYTARVQELVRASQRVLFGHQAGSISDADWRALAQARDDLGGGVTFAQHVAEVR